MENKLCVFCSSSDDLDKKYYKLAEDLVLEIKKSKYSIMHGAGSIGLMGSLLNAANKNNVNIIGVVPEKLNKPHIVNSETQKVVVTKDMKDRKEYLRNKSFAFIALPGGFGTLEEILEVITLKQLKYHNKAIVFVNAYGYFDNLFKQFEYMFETNFANQAYKNIYFIANTPSEAINYINNYKHENIYDKYLRE
ncbi:MAG: TIGR00730 family Rossman fold protein [Bacteroidales bacterium]|nr:TIGR00730 family Rossman fold protein [Bacteroidales bacterium]MCK9499468.1 TIGR00730 family Rossman fold protein [Bacteroidales bacterium]NLB87442.1 TIGR00730 family Rossman fold protein [Bacteroidales bacterium]